jgi:sporulation integral membrane protein YlbJ
MSAPPKRSTTTLLALVIVFLTLSLVMYPEEGFQAAMSGLKLFWDAVFPALLPFFILSELMLGIGVVHALGVLLEPLMRPLFSVPGVGAFALSMGLAAGYPMDAVITAKFRKSQMCSRIEGERLLAFTNTADPLFMFGSVAVGMFKNPSLGMLLAVAHYISSFLVGVSFKFYGRGEKHTYDAAPHPRRQGNLFVRAYREMIRAREEDGRPFGKLLGDAVNDSIKTILMICGFIIFFSVLIKVLTLSGVIPLLALPISGLFALLGIDQDLVTPFLSGMFEIDIGSAQAANASAPLVQQLLIVSAIIAWSGLSVFAQVASVLIGTDIRFTPYVIARILHAVLAAIFTVLLYHMGLGQVEDTVFATFANSSPSPTSIVSHLQIAFGALYHWVILLSIALALSLGIYLIRRIRVIFWMSRVRDR